MNFRTFAATAAFAGLIASALAAQTKRPMTFADLQAMKRVSDPQISPSGKWVLFSVTEVELEKNAKHNHLWAVPLDGSAKEHEVSTGDGESNGRFSPDGKWVMYTSGDQISVAPWNDGAGKLGKGHAVTSLKTGADGGLWAPDSKHFLFTSDVYPDCESNAPNPESRAAEEATCNTSRDAEEAKSQVKAQVFTELLYRHWDHYQGPKRSHLFYAAVDGKGEEAAPRDITPKSVIGDHVAPTFSLGGPLGYAISPDGKEIAYEVNLDAVPAESTNNDIFTLAVGAEPRTAKKVSTSPGSDDGPAYSPNGKYLAWRSQAHNGYESDKFDLVVMDRATGNIQNETSSFDGWVDEFNWLLDPPANSELVAFTSASKGAEPIFGVMFGKDLKPKGVERMFPAGGEFGDLRQTVDGKQAIATLMFADRPSEIVKLDQPMNQVLTHLNDSLLSQIDLPKLEPFWFSGANGTKVEGFLIKPPNFDPSRKYPVKFLMHGGPQTAWGDSWSYRWNWELFAADGYVVVGINRRGSTGYGQKFVEEVSGDWGGRAYTDLMRGLDYAEQHYSFIDKDRECALGASYGGFMADWVLTHTNRFKCIVTHDGMYNPQSAFGTTEELWFNQWEFRPLNGAGPDATVVMKPSHPWDFYDKPASQDPYRKWSPMLSIKNAKTPTLVIHGQRDYRLDVSEGLQLFNSLQMLHVPSKMVYFENEGHWVLKPKDSEFWYQQVNDWTDRWLGMGKYASIGPEKNPFRPSFFNIQYSSRLSWSQRTVGHGFSRDIKTRHQTGFSRCGTLGEIQR